jgi:hypothetical protein
LLAAGCEKREECGGEKVSCLHGSLLFGFGLIATVAGHCGDVIADFHCGVGFGVG